MTHSVPEQAVYKAHEHLEDAESELAYFIREAKPQTDEARVNVQYMDAARDRLRKFIRDWEEVFDEITEDLPEGGE